MAYMADPAPDTDLTDPDDTRDLVQRFVLPGILALRGAGEEEIASATGTSAASTSNTTTKGAVQ